jgi:acetyl-CoA C-acetyltransferase
MLSAVAVKNHFNGSMNPFAQYPFKTTREEVEGSVMVASPLRIMDCSPITDGAAAVILTTVDIAKKLGKPIIKIIGSGHATDSIALHSRDDMTTLLSTTVAAEKALKMAGKSIKDINFAEVHDCFTIAEIVVTESLGIFAPGKGGEAAVKGETGLEGSFPINTSGGLKSKGHPVGATGVAQVIEVVKQLRGTAENGRQLKKRPKIGMTQNMGGSGGSTLVHILEVA